MRESFKPVLVISLTMIILWMLIEHTDWITNLFKGISLNNFIWLFIGGVAVYFTIKFSNKK